MNRRRFLALLPAPILFPLAVAATDCDEVTIPVEPCPCDCLDEETGEFYLCDMDGTPWGEDSDDPVPVDGPATVTEFPQIIQLPSTGTGSSLDREAA